MKNYYKILLFTFATFTIISLVGCNRTKNKIKSDTTEKVTVTKNKVTAITDKNTSQDITKPAVATTENIPNSKNTESIQNYKMKNEIVYFYNDCVNSIKSKASIAKIVYQEANPVENFTPTGPFTKNANKEFFSKCKLEYPICNNKELFKKYFPVATQTYCSKLHPSMVNRASCYYDRGNYFVEIYLKDDPEGTQDYSSTCMNIISPHFVATNAKISLIKEKNIKASCKGCILKATIDEKTGNVTSLYHYMPTYLCIKAIGTYNTFAFYMIQNWSITY